MWLSQLFFFLASTITAMPSGIGLTSIAHSSSGPSMDAVLCVLKKSGFHDVEFKKLPIPSTSTPPALPFIVNFIKQQDPPLFILHHATYSKNNDQNGMHRRLTNSSDTTPPTEYEISAHQIGFWTCIGMIVFVVSGISALYNMEIIPDSLLFAKFQSSRTNKND